MMIRKTIAVAVLILLGIASAGAVVALFTGYSGAASAGRLPDALSSIPPDYEFLFGANVPKLADSPAFAKLRQSPQAGKEYAAFIEKTGIDPARDISYLVGAGRSLQAGRGEGLVIASGTFDRDAVLDYVRARSAPVEIEYGGSTVMMIPDPKSGALENGIVFLHEDQIAAGDLDSLKAALDLRGRAGQSILSSPTMAALIRDVNPDDMLWFAGDASGLLAKAPKSVPLNPNASNIASVTGALNIAEAVTGRLTATTLDADSAVKLADALRGLISFGQLAAQRNPELKALLGGIAVTQDAARVSVNLAFSADLLDKLGQSRRAF